MDQKFANLVEHLAPKLERLMAAVPCRNGKLPADLPKSEIYTFSARATGTYTSGYRTTCAAVMAVIAGQAPRIGRPLSPSN